MEATSNQTLILNADYSPIAVCDLHKAIILLYLEKAEILSKAKGMIRSVSDAFPIPTVIKLNKYVHIPYVGVMLTRENVFKRDSYTCQYCGSHKNLTLDHVIARSKGGKSVWKNLVTACKQCNAKKGDKSLKECGLVLAKSPFRPSHIMFIRDFSGKMMDHWHPYLSKKQKVLG